MKSNALVKASPVVDLADLKHKSVRGGLVTMASQGANVLIQLASTVLLSRLLTPDDFGILAMVTAVTAFAGLFRDLGLSSAAIQKATLTHAQQSNLFWINVALGSVLTILLAVASPLVASFYGKPEVKWITVALSSSFVIGSLSAQSGALLVREMRFARLAPAGIMGGLMTLVISGTLALLGYRYWALVWGQLGGAITTTAVLLLLSPFRPKLPSRGTELRAMLKFGADVTAFDFLNYFHRNLDNILIGRFWGADALGLYSRAYQILMFPINNLRGPINTVAFPAMSRLQAQPDAYRAYYRRVTQLLAYVSMPLTAFFFVVSAPLVELLLGRDWLGVSPIFSILAVTAFIQPVAGLRGAVLLSSGQGRLYMKWGILNTVCVSIGFLIGVRWGAVGVAVSYAITNYAILYPSMLLAFKNTPLRVRDFFMPISVPATSSLAAALVTYAFARAEWGVHIPLVIRIASLGALYFGAYIGSASLLPGGWTDLKNIVGLLRRKRIVSA